MPEASPSPMQASGPKQLAEWRKRLELMACESVGRARIGQFFDIVVEHPESLPAVKDLRACLAGTSLQSHFIRSFKAAIQHRLLHAGTVAPHMSQIHARI